MKCEHTGRYQLSVHDFFCAPCPQSPKDKPRRRMSCGLYAVWTADWVASIMSRRGRVKARREPERSAFLSVPIGWDMAKSRQFSKSKSVCAGWSGQYLDFALYGRRSAAE